MGNCLTISHTCEPYLPSSCVLLSVPGVAEQMRTLAGSKILFFLFQVLIRCNQEERGVQDFLFVPSGVGELPFQTFLNEVV